MMGRFHPTVRRVAVAITGSAGTLMGDRSTTPRDDNSDPGGSAEDPAPLDPTGTDHPTGEGQAAQNAADEPPA
jgi:hypothetical protein